MDPHRYLSFMTRQIGVATACLSMIPPLTRNTGAPRVVGLAHPMGRHAPPITPLLTKKPWLLPRLAGGHIPIHLKEARP